MIAEGSTCRFRDMNSKETLKAIKERHFYFKESCKVLGITDFEPHRLRCGCLSNLPILDINRI